MELAALVARRQEIRRQIKALETDLEKIDNDLKTVAAAAFAGAADNVTTRMRDGLTITRKRIRTDLRSTSPRDTAAYLAGLDVDVFAPGLVSKTKLDALDARYSDGRVLLRGEPIPGLRAQPVWSYDYEAAAAMTAGDLL